MLLAIAEQPDARASAFEEFRAAARAMWTNADLVLRGVALSDEEPATPGVLAALASARRPASRGLWVMGPNAFRLKLSRRLLDMGPDAVRRIMIHEAVHLGVHGHGQKFRDICRAHGGVVSENALRGGGVFVQQKQGARYRTVRTFENEADATRWVKEQLALLGGRWRVCQ